MKKFFQEIIEFHHDMNQLILQIFKENEKQITPAIYALISHSINAHQIWNARILQEETFGVYDIHTLEVCREMDEDNYQTTLKIIDTYDLEQTVIYQNSKGQAFQNTVGEILFHISNHFSHHRGQLMSLLKKQGIQPPMTDFIFYKR